MVKFGKYLKSHKIQEWENDYIDYKKLKRTIADINSKIGTNLYEEKPDTSPIIKIEEEQNLRKESVQTNKEEPDNNPIIKIEEEQNSRKESIQTKNELTILYSRPNGHYLKIFINQLEEEFKKVYVFFVSMEKELYVQINSHLYRKDNLNTFTLEELYQDLESLCLTAYLAKSLKEFINDNTTAIVKILKKFDKKFEEYFGCVSIKFLSIQLNVQNSDLEYMLQYKVIDETNALIEYLLNNMAKEILSRHINASNNIQLPTIKRKINEIKEYIIAIDKKNLYQVKYKEWFYYIRSGEKIIKNNPQNSTNDIYNPLISTPLVNDALIMKLLSKRALSLLKEQESTMSKENKINIGICLAQTFFYMMSYTIIIPSTLGLLCSFEKTDLTQIFPFIWACVPLMTYVSIFIFNSLQFRDKHYKLSFSLSFVIMILGNGIYLLKIEKPGKVLTALIPIFLSRTFIGLGSNPLESRKYITHFVPKQNLHSISLIYLLSQSLGFALGPLVGYLLYLIPDYFENPLYFLHLDKYGWFAIFLIGIYLILLFVTLFFFTPPMSDKFHISDEAIASEYDGFGKDPSLSIMNQGVCPLISTNEKKMLSEIEVKLNAYNEQNQFSDTNLIPVNIQQIIKNEKKICSYLNKGMIISFFLFLTVRMINEGMIVLLAQNLDEKFNESTYKINFIILVITLFLESFFSVGLAKIISSYSHTRKLLIILLILAFLLSSSLITCILLSARTYYGFFTITLIMTTLIELITSNLVANIMPPNWKFLGLTYGKFINTPIVLGKVLGCVLAYFIDVDIVSQWDVKVQEKNFWLEVSLGSIIPFLFLILIITVVINFKDLRVKAISRILRSQYHNKLNL